MSDHFHNFYEKLSKIQSKRIILLLFLALTFTLIFILNYLYPLMIVDDWSYTYVYGDFPNHKITNLYDVLISQYNHYIMWSGRTVAHTIVQILLMFDTLTQDILNSLAYLGLACLLYKYANWGNKTNTTIFIVVSCLLWLYHPSFASTLLWITGSGNYLYTTLIILGFIYIYYTFYRRKESTDGVFKSIGMFLFGIIAGWTNENMTIAVIFLISAMLLMLWKNKVSIPIWAYIGLIGLVIGCLFMLLAPGNQVRLNAHMEGHGWESTSSYSWEVLKPRVETMLRLYKKGLLKPIIIALILILFYAIKGTEAQRKNILGIGVLLFITAHVAFIIMLGSPEFPDRALTGIVILILASIGILYGGLNFQLYRVRTIHLLFTLTLCVFFTMDYIKEIQPIVQISKIVKNREVILEEGKIKDQKDFVFYDGIELPEKYFWMDCNDDSTHYVNRFFCYKYGINTVIVYPDPKYSKE